METFNNSKSGALLLGSLLLLFGGFLNAQEVYRVAASNGKLVIKNVNDVHLTGYPGQEIVFTAKRIAKDSSLHDIRANGLRRINARGQVDNTGLGLAVNRISERVEVGQVGRRSDCSYTIQVPVNMHVYYSNSTHEAQQLIVENIQGEIEADCHHNNITLRNVSGPTIVNTIFGNIRAEFDGIQPKNDMALHSTYGDIEFLVPPSSQASFRMLSSYGNMYTDLDLDLEKKGNYTQKGAKSKDCDCPSDRARISGDLNGGGVLITMRATYENIYLRKK